MMCNVLHSYQNKFWSVRLSYLLIIFRFDKKGAEDCHILGSMRANEIRMTVETLIWCRVVEGKIKPGKYIYWRLLQDLHLLVTSGKY